MQVSEGDGVGLGSEDDGSEDGVVAGSVEDVDAGDVVPPLPAVGVSDSSGSFVSFADFDGDADGDADASGDAVPALVPTVLVTSRGSAVSLASASEPPSADAPGAADRWVENGASVPSSARLRAPAASRKPAVMRSTRRRRRR